MYLLSQPVVGVNASAAASVVGAVPVQAGPPLPKPPLEHAADSSAAATTAALNLVMCVTRPMTRLSPRPPNPVTLKARQVK
jgi:hypothetical protein